MNDFNLGDLDLADFSEFSFDVTNEFESRYIKPPKSIDKGESFCKPENAIELAKDLKLKKGERVNLVVNGSFIFGDFIEAFIRENNYNVEKLTISTLSLGQDNIDGLCYLLEDDYVQELNLIISDYFYSHEKQGLVPYIYQHLDKENRFQLAVAGTHCKTVTMKTENGGFVVMHGSANLRSSANLEQVCIEENEELYNFYETYQDKILNKYKTINKSLRTNKLWEVVK